MEKCIHNSHAQLNNDIYNPESTMNFIKNIVLYDSIPNYLYFSVIHLTNFAQVGIQNTESIITNLKGGQRQVYIKLTVEFFKILFFHRKTNIPCKCVIKNATTPFLLLRILTCILLVWFQVFCVFQQLHDISLTLPTFFSLCLEFSFCSILPCQRSKADYLLTNLTKHIHSVQREIAHHA